MLLMKVLPCKKKLRPGFAPIQLHYVTGILQLSKHGTQISKLGFPC